MNSKCFSNRFLVNQLAEFLVDFQVEFIRTRTGHLRTSPSELTLVSPLAC